MTVPWRIDLSRRGGNRAERRPPAAAYLSNRQTTLLPLPDGRRPTGPAISASPLSPRPTRRPTRTPLADFVSHPLTTQFVPNPFCPISSFSERGLNHAAAAAASTWRSMPFTSWGARGRSKGGGKSGSSRELRGRKYEIRRPIHLSSCRVDLPYEEESSSDDSVLKFSVRRWCPRH